MFEVVVEHDDVAGRGLQDQSRYVGPLQPPDLPAFPNVLLKCICVVVTGAVAAGNDAQGAAVAREGVEVEGDLDAENAIGIESIGMPAGVAGIVVAVAAGVVEVVAADAGGDIVDARVVEKGAEKHALVGEGKDAGALYAIVFAPVVTSAVRGPDGFEFVDDFVSAVGQQTGKIEIAEGVEECQLLRCELCLCHGEPSFSLSNRLSGNCRP